ncbi:phage portal protein [Clostridium botulinum]|uniref:phage portal protein n=1 Tax=Clostridium botulinum TaxID=1491 RepID=UPI001C9AA8CF|nr:phage portal protein [Clostridium botulinum]MBY6860809.1 phage portal protein [Clostridium botulinum]MBY7043802.1 phage portal protein [Clostridium botulinum]
MKLFNFKRRAKVEDEENPDLNRWLALNEDEVTIDDLMNIPTVVGCVEIISNTIASLPIQLFKTENENVIPVTNDRRLTILNDLTGDVLNGFELKKAMTHDYLTVGSGYSYINRRLNTVHSLHYVENRYISVLCNENPIFKIATINVSGNEYKEYDFIRLLRRTTNGVTGKGILNENFEVLKMVYNCLRYENVLVSSGGNKKGFIKAQSKLSEEAIENLKAQWNHMYNNNKSNCVVLNNGLEFQESANTSVEMQLVENKKANALELCKLFLVPEKLLNGTCTDEEYQSFIKICILPILSAFETALNVALLSNVERESFYFKFDTKELMKADIQKRMSAYAIAVKHGIMQIDEVRFQEDLAPLGLEFIKLGLQDVLYNPVTKEIYTPNTNKTADITTMKGGDENKNRDKEQ